MKLQALLFVAALFGGAVLASVSADIDVDGLAAANPGWGRRQLEQRARRQLLKNDKHDKNNKNSKNSKNKNRVPNKTIPLTYTILTRSGAAANQGDAPMGGLVGEDGSPVDLQVARGGVFGAIADPAETCGDQNKTCTPAPYYRVAGQQEISQNPDYTSVLTVGRKIYSFVHFEGPLPSQLYFMELSQDPESGALKVIQQTVVDWSEWGGIWLPCAGSVTPWGTHLGSEEYEPDAKWYALATSLDGNETTSLKNLDGGAYGDLISFVRYFGLYYPFKLQDALVTFNPYRYGWITELRAKNGFKYTNVKHYAMGRISHEMGDVMPDRKTVYMTDDGTNTALWKFVADRKNDLSSGTLYIAKIKQQSAAGAIGNPATTGFDVKWIKLGSANQRQIENIVNSGITFADIFDLKTPNKTAPFCPTGYTSINAGQADAKHECLKLKDNSSRTKLAAAFLESRRYGAMLGGTTEFSKLEGLVLNTERGTLAFSASDVRYGMESNKKQGAANTKYDIGGPDDIRLEYNPCGCVYEIVLEKNYDSKVILPLLCGVPTPTDKVNSCSVDSIASPDNLALIPEQQILIIGEDTANHQNDMLWAYELDTRKLTRVATSPYGSEFTSTDWYEIGDFGYLTAVVQHPYGESDEKKIVEAESTGRAGTVGYIGPLTLSDLSGKDITFASLPYAQTNSEKHNTRVSGSLRTS